MRPRAEIAALIACVAIAAPVAVAVAGCGSDSSSTAPATASTTTTSTTAASASGGAAASTDKVTIADFAFDPETIRVDAGTEVTWTNADDATHTATADDGSFDTGDLGKGDSKSVTLRKAGTYTYFCRFHPFMKATVEVQ